MSAVISGPSPNGGYDVSKPLPDPVDAQAAFAAEWEKSFNRMEAGEDDVSDAELECYSKRRETQAIGAADERDIERMVWEGSPVSE
ncbi:MAG: hypothetical protein IT428_06180 [Planctomycetaceae bacterium]|nr:hypothetical protein [Planctomycetaceae bacterium]